MDIEEKNKITKYLFLLLLPFLIGTVGCNTNKYLKSDESLIKKNKIVIKSDTKVKNKRGLKYELSTVTKQKPNDKWFLVARTRLWAYYKTQAKSDTTKWDRWVRKTIAEPPTLYNKNIAESTAQSMQYYLQHKGYNDAVVTDTVRHKRKRKRSIVIYTAYLNNRYLIDSVFFLSQDQKIKKILLEQSENTLLRKGEPVSKSLFDKEHLRLTKEFQNSGYAYFNNSYFYVEGDTSNYKVNLYYEVLKPPKSEEHQVYHIGDVTVIPDYDASLGLPPIDTMINGIRFLKRNSDMKVKPKNIIKSIFLKKGDLYKEDNYIKTNRQLGALDIYKRVSVDPKVDPADSSKLNFTIRLTAKKRMVFGADIELNNSTYNGAQNSLVGIAGSVSFRHRNLFRSANLFIAELQSGVALDVGNKDQLFYSVDIKAQGDLYMPRFVDPTKALWLINKLGLPYKGSYQDFREKARTRLSVGYNYLSLFQFYNYNSFSFSFGYDLKRNASKRYILNQLGINYLQVQTKIEFDTTILEKNPFLENSFDDQLFTGALFRDYTYTYLGKTNKYGASWYFSWNVELSGAEVFLANKIYNQTSNNSDTFKLFNRVDFAQFASLRLDGRYYKKISNSQSIAFRLFGGIARPYGFTGEVPYTKQFYSGGPYSIRAWRIRELGPGQYRDSLTLPGANTNTPFYQVGDIQIEFNAEYRFDIFWVFEGALFLDAGNVWTLKRDPSRIGSQFLLNPRRENGGEIINDRFTKQIAVGTGFGLRADFTYFIIRFDLGLKLRTPYPDPLNGDRHWRFNKLTSTSFTNDINYNLAIGYPF